MSNNGRNSEYFSPTRKSVVLNFDVEENIKMQICISGAAFDIISKNQYLIDHFAFICYFSNAIICYEFSAQQKINFHKIFLKQLNQFFRVVVIANTVSDIPLCNMVGTSAFIQQEIRYKINQYIEKYDDQLQQFKNNSKVQLRKGKRQKSYIKSYTTIQSDQNENNFMNNGKQSPKNINMNNNTSNNIS